jgi:AcrR family transcriptional regulator
VTQNVEDLRVRRTRKLLQKALLDATSEKGFANVTVRDLTERAMVNRATFYRHYQDKYDLLRQYIVDLSGMIDSDVEGSAGDDRAGEAPEGLPGGLVHLLRHMQAHADFYRVMLGKQGDPAFCVQSFRGYIEQGVRRMLASQPPQADAGGPPIDLIVSYLLHAGLGAIVWWLEDDSQSTPEQMAVWLHRLSQATLSVSRGGLPSTLYKADTSSLP